MNHTWHPSKYDVLLRDKIRQIGEKLPKKHGAWYRIHVYDNHWLVFDTWNNQVYHYPNGAEPSDTNNMYHCVYVFYDLNGRVENYESVKGYMNNFWYGHLSLKV